MVLESLINPFKIGKNPSKVFFVGFVYSTIALFLGNWIFKEYASLIMVFLTTMACIPFLYNSFRIEEKKTFEQENKLLKEHSKILSFVLFLFLGFVASFTLWYIVLPSSWTQSIFHSQTLTIQSITAKTTTGSANSSVKIFTTILLNNMKVLVFCILFAFLYGAGAIFILTWNASVISTAIGNYIRSNLALITKTIGLTKYTDYFHIVSIGILRYFLHGLPEMGAYIIAGLAGSIISVAVIRESFGTKKFEKTLLDSSNLIIIAIIILIIAAFIEVYITPSLF